jgi:hypothetical protein
VTDGEVVSLAGDWGGQGSTESIDHWWVSAHSFAWLFEGLLHQGVWVVGQQGELLVLGKGVVTCSEEIFCDLTITEWLFESSGWGVSLDTCDLSQRSVLGALGSVHLFHHHLLLVLLLLVVVLLLLARHTEIHKSLNGLFSLGSLWLQLVEWIIEHLSVVGKELAHLLEVDLNDVVLGE